MMSLSLSLFVFHVSFSLWPLAVFGTEIGSAISRWPSSLSLSASTLTHSIVIYIHTHTHTHTHTTTPSSPQHPSCTAHTLSSLHSTHTLISAQHTHSQLCTPPIM